MTALANSRALAAQPQRRFVFRGNNLEALRDHVSKEMLLDGPAGTGKTSAILFRLYAALTDPRFPGVRALLLRKTRRSLTESGLVTWERDILGPHLSHFGKARREQRHTYHFPRGCELVVGGLDDVGKIMSSDYDIIAVLEATEAEEDEIEMLTTRLRNAHHPDQCLLLDCNPSYPQHWLNQRALNGHTRRFKSFHRDNPSLYDWQTQTWTAKGRDYIAILERLTGPRRARLLEGRWVQAEGVIYPEWDAEVHLRDTIAGGTSRVPPRDWPVELWVDFGYSALHPMVILWAAEDPFGNFWVYRELHESNRLVEDIAREVKRINDREGRKDQHRPARIICDHDLEDRKTLERYLEQPTTPAVKDVIPGIQSVAKRLQKDETTGEPSLYVLRDALIRRDPKIAELKRPCCLAEEMDAYIWSDSDKKDEPVKDQDDAADACRYGVYFRDRRYNRGMRLERY